MMSVHDALEAWQAGEITAAHAMPMTGVSNVLELLAFAHQSDVEIRPGFLPRDEEQARRVTDLITRLLVEADVSHRYLSKNTPSVE
ncbi:MAG: hypothetical protein ACJ8AI_00605 [Rhodopila sp.]